MTAQAPENAGPLPCLVLAHVDSEYAGQAGSFFRRLGWDVYRARTGPEARRLVRLLDADLVLLEADLPDESGWLTCDKLTRERPQVKAVLVCANPDPFSEQLAAFVGASALVNRADGLDALLHEVCGAPLPVTG